MVDIIKWLNACSSNTGDMHNRNLLLNSKKARNSWKIAQQSFAMTWFVCSFFSVEGLHVLSALTKPWISSTLIESVMLRCSVLGDAWPTKVLIWRISQHTVLSNHDFLVCQWLEEPVGTCRTLLTKKMSLKISQNKECLRTRKYFMFSDLLRINTWTRAFNVIHTLFKPQCRVQ